MLPPIAAVCYRGQTIEGVSVRAWRLAVFLSIGWLVACGADDRDAGRRRAVPSKTCEIEQTECDIEEESCLESLLELTACAREDDTPELPEVQHISTAEFAQQLRDEAEAEGVETTPWDQILPELSLQPKGQSSIDAAVDVLTESVVAFYDDETKVVTILGDTKVTDSRSKLHVVMHEFTHYLQDRGSDLADMRKRAGSSSDASAALGALIEGEATVNSTRGSVFLMHTSLRAVDWQGFFDSLEDNMVEAVKASDAPLYAAIQLLPYSVGTRFIGDAWGTDDRSMVTRLFDNWPHALRDWMVDLPWKSGASTQKPLDCGPPLPPEGFELYELDSFGVAGAFALIVAAGGADLELASAVQNDAFAVYLDNAQADDPKTATRVVGVWRLRFDPGAVGKFVDRIESLGLDTQTFDDELVIRVASDASIDALTSDALAACPKLEELKPMKAEDSMSSAIRQLLH